MAISLSGTQQFTQGKIFSATTAAAAMTAANAFISGTLDVDPDNSYSVVFLPPYFDGANHNISIQYSYLTYTTPSV